MRTINGIGWLALLAFISTPLCGEEKATAQTLAAPARLFNVLNYGAVADDKTDNSEAFSACLKALVEAGGGRMYLPAGVYRGRIVIPPVSKPITSWITVEIVGELEPTPVFGTVGSFPMQQNGTIVKSLAESGSAVIAAAPSPKALYGRFSAVYAVLRNLDVRTDDNPHIGGIDLEWAIQCRIENVFINTGVYSVQASRPTHGAKGLITPANNNGALTILRNVVVTGFDTGIVVNEHTDADNINLACNIHGLSFPFAHHASRFGRVGAQRCTHAITVTAHHAFTIEQLDIEHAGAGQTDRNNAWQANVADINDSGNLGIGEIRYWVVLGNVGASAGFIRNGGTGIRARRIGAEPEENNTAAKTK